MFKLCGHSSELGTCTRLQTYLEWHYWVNSMNESEAGTDIRGCPESGKCSESQTEIRKLYS